MGFVVRWIFAFLLVALTYNPTDWNYSRWAAENWSEQMPLAVLFGLVLLVGWIIYLRATLRSIGPFGVLLVLALMAALGWVLYDQGWITLDNPSLNAWLAVIAASVVLGIGLTWSIIRRRLSGQVDIDDVDEE